MNRNERLQPFASARLHNNREADEVRDREVRSTATALEVLNFC